MAQPNVEPKTEAERVETTDPVLLMLGVGKSLWESESGDKFIERIRSEELTSPPHNPQGFPAENAPESVWRRIEEHQGEEFRTARKYSFTYELEGPGIWFFREGRRINRKLSRRQVETAIARCPLKSTTAIKDLMDYSYLYALLMDPRIRGQAW